MFIADRDIAYKVDDYEEIKDDNPVVITPPVIIN